MKTGLNISLDLSRYTKWVNLIIFLFLYIIIVYLISLKPLSDNSYDYWMHVGSIERFSQNLAYPQHTYDEPESIRVRNFSPYQAILAVIVKLFGFTPINAFTLGAIVSVGLLFWGIWLMSNVLNKSIWLPSCLLLSVLFIVGKGYGYSQEIYTRILPITSGYPSTLSIALSLICWYNVNKLLEMISFKRLCGVTILIALVLLIHQLVFLHFSVILFFWIILSNVPLRNKLYIFGAIAAALPLVLIWPYFSPFSVSYSAVLGPEQKPDNVFNSEMATHRIDIIKARFYTLNGVKNAFGPALFGLLLLPTLPSKIRLRLSFLVLFTLFISTIGPKINIPASGYRWAMTNMLLLQFVIGIHIAKLADLVLAIDSKRIARAIITMVIASLVVIIILKETRQVWNRYSHYIWPSNSIELSWTKRWEQFAREAKLYVKQDDTIAADVYTSFSMTAFQLKPVVFSRRKNIINTLLILLYNEDTSINTRRQILEKLDVQYFIVEPGQTHMKVEKELRSLGGEVFRQNKIILYKTL